MLKRVDSDEAISVFCSALAKNDPSKPAEIESSSVWLFPSFEIPMPFKLRLGCVTVDSTRTDLLSATHVASRSKIYFSPSVSSGNNDGHLQACLASVASSILTLCFGRLVDYGWDHFGLFSGEGPPHLLPYIGYGPGANPMSTSDLSRQGQLAHVLWAHIENSTTKEGEDLVGFLRCCRLFWLSMKAAQFDQSLAFSLVVAALESVASQEVDVGRVYDGNWREAKKKIKQIAEESGLPTDFIQILPEKLNQHYLKRRVSQFVKDNAIVSECLIPSWSEAIYKDLGVDYSPRSRAINDGDDDEIERKILEDFPSAVDWLIKESYSYRSKLLHVGQSHPAPRFESFDRYLKIVWSKRKGFPDKEKYPSLRFISAVTRSSVLRHYVKKFSVGK